MESIYAIFAMQILQTISQLFFTDLLIRYNFSIKSFSLNRDRNPKIYLRPFRNRKQKKFRQFRSPNLKSFNIYNLDLKIFILWKLKKQCEIKGTKLNVGFSAFDVELIVYHYLIKWNLSTKNSYLSKYNLSHISQYFVIFWAFILLVA